MMKKFIYIIIVGCVTLSCAKISVENPNTIHSQEFAVVFSAQMGGIRLTPTKAMTDNNMNYVNRVDILAFEVAEDLTERFAYATKATKIADNEGYDKKTITARVIKDSNKKYRFVLLANLTEQQTSIISDISVGTLKNEVLPSITFENTGKWNVDEDEFTPIPMWGETDVLSVNDQLASTGIGNVKLIRMVAQIDIIVTEAAKSDFSLETVMIYNFNSIGNVAPAPAAWDSASSSVTEPTIPPTSGFTTVPEIYTVTDPLNQRLTNTIYAFESVAGSASELDKNISIVVGGKYRQSSDVTYYRVDFLENDRSEFMNILRNHLYRINITEVSATGYASPKEAFDAKPVNLKAEPVVWNYTETGYITFNDQYILGLNRDKFTFTQEATTSEDLNNKLIVLTDYPGGWKIDSISYTASESQGWLSIDKNSGQSNEKGYVSLNLDVNSNTSVPQRTCYIHVSAGRLSKVIPVIQLRIRAFSLDIFDLNGAPTPELIFSNYSGITDIEPSGFKIAWKPHGVGNVCKYSIFHAGTLPLFDFGSGDQIAITGQHTNMSGIFTYSNIKPNPFLESEIAEDGSGNPFLEKASYIEYTVQDDDQFASKYIAIRQVNFAAVPIVESAYVMDGNLHFLKIKSNSSWKLTLVDDPKNVVSDLTNTTGGYDIINGQDVTFRIINDLGENPVLGDAQVTFRLECTNLNRFFLPREFTINCISGVIKESSNCYIIQPDSKAILIPVNRANQAALLGSDRISSSDLIEAKLVWTDNINGLSNLSNIKLVAASGNGDTGYIAIAPGSAVGNAVVAVTVNNVIKWSWHIWVTDYVPTGTGSPEAVWMDRNLGATTNAVGNPDSYGLYYQWGRKDPFPGARIALGNTATVESAGRKIYNGKGVELTYGKIPNTINGTGINFLVTLYENNLINTVENPMNYYSTYTTAPTDWFTNNRSNINNDLWNEGGAKTIYDPCPDGWRIPVRDPNLTYANSPYHWGNNTTSIISLAGTAGLDKPKWLGGTNYGSGWTYKGEYYPAAGAYNITALALRFSNVGTQGIYASATPVGGASLNVYRYGFMSTTAVPSQQGTRSNTHSVRCVKE